MGRRAAGIEVGDRVVACGVHRGEVVLVAKSRAWMLVRVVAGEPTRSGYLLCTPAEAERMNGWWTQLLRSQGRMGTRAWARGAARPVVAGRADPRPGAGRPERESLPALSPLRVAGLPSSPPDPLLAMVPRVNIGACPAVGASLDSMTPEKRAA